MREWLVGCRRHCFESINIAKSHVRMVYLNGSIVHRHTHIDGALFCYFWITISSENRRGSSHGFENTRINLFFWFSPRYDLPISFTFQLMHNRSASTKPNEVFRSTPFGLVLMSVVLMSVRRNEIKYVNISEQENEIWEGKITFSLSVFIYVADSQVTSLVSKWKWQHTSELWSGAFGKRYTLNKILDVRTWNQW